MKNPEPDENLDGASFMGTNLLQALCGQSVDNIFGSQDLPKIKILDREAAAELLKKHHKKK